MPKPNESKKSNDLEARVEELEKGDAWHATDEVVEIEVKRPLDHVVPVRLSTDMWTQLRREARDLGVGPSTLARMWILEKLKKPQDAGIYNPLRPAAMLGLSRNLQIRETTTIGPTPPPTLLTRKSTAKRGPSRRK